MIPFKLSLYYEIRYQVSEWNSWQGYDITENSVNKKSHVLDQVLVNNVNQQYRKSQESKHCIGVGKGQEIL